MNRKRKRDKGLPQRVYVKHGAYYFVPVQPMRNPANGKVQAWIRMTAVVDGESKMLAALSVLKDDKRILEGSMSYACAEFKSQMIETSGYSKETLDSYSRFLNVVSDEFEEFHASEVTTKDCAGFLRDNYKGKANTAKKIAALMSKLFKFIIGELGLRQDNPIDQLDMSTYRTSRREVLPTHEQIMQIRQAGQDSKPRKDTGLVVPTYSGPMFACIIDMSYLLWARAIDVRLLKESQIEDGYIRIKPTKTRKTSGKVVDILVTPAIAEVLARARQLKAERQLVSDYLFVNRDNQPYTKSGLSSMWKRAATRMDIEVGAMFKDIRALGATDAARGRIAKGEIQTRLAHTSSQTTDIYIKEAIPDVSDIVMDLPWAKGIK